MLFVNTHDWVQLELLNGFQSDKMYTISTLICTITKSQCVTQNNQFALRSVLLWMGYRISFFFIKKRIQQPQTDLDKKTTSRQIVETRRRPDFVVCKIFISNLKYWSENVVLVNCFCFTMNLRQEVILRINISWIIQGLILFTYLALTRHKYWFWFLPWWRSAMREISDCIVSIHCFRKCGKYKVFMIL